MEKRTIVISLTREEVDSLKEFCDDNLAAGSVIISQTKSPTAKGLVTHVMVKDLPETMTDITDTNIW